MAAKKTAPAKKTPPKKTPPPAAKPAPAPPVTDQEAINRLLGPGVQGASALGKQIFGEGSLGRLGYAGPDSQNVVDQYKGIYNQYASGQPSQATQDILAQYKSGLQGYMAPELQGMREQAQRGLDTAYTAQLRDLQRVQGSSGGRLQAAGQVMQLGAKRNQAQGQLEQDLLVKNADEMQKRLGAYNLANTTAEQNAFSQRNDTLDAYQKALAAQRTDTLNTNIYNNTQAANEKSGYLGTLFGGLNLEAANKAAASSDIINQGALDVAGQALGKGVKRKKMTNPNPNDPYYQAAIDRYNAGIS